MKLIAVCAALLIVLGGLFIILIASDSPLWRYDRYVLEGSFTGASCSLMLDGRPIIGDRALGTQVLIPQDRYGSIDAPPGYGMNQEPPNQGIFCQGLSVTIKAPPLTNSAAGSYGIVEREAALGPGLAVVELSSDDIGPSWWPFAIGGVKLVAHEGALAITSMTDSTIRGTLRVVARRHSMGF